MAREGFRRRDFFGKLRRQYRVVFIDDESLEEVTSYNLTMGKLYIIISSIFVGLFLLIVTITLVTPLKYYIPGYGNDKARMRTIKLKQTVDSLNDLVAQQQKYEDNIKKVIAGERGKTPDTTMLDMKRVRDEDMNSIIPKPDQIKKDAIETIKKEERQKKKAK